YLFYLISVRPPGSTLFPYTTLFRSRRGDGLRRQDRRGHAATCARRPQGDRSLSRRRRAGSHRRDGERLVSAPSATPLLAIRGVHAAYGKIEALKGVDLDIKAGEIVALIG